MKYSVSGMPSVKGRSKEFRHSWLAVYNITCYCCSSILMGSSESTVYVSELSGRRVLRLGWVARSTSSKIDCKRDAHSNREIVA